MPVSYCKIVYSITAVILFTVIQLYTALIYLQYEYCIFNLQYHILIYRTNTVYCIHEYNYCIFTYSITCKNEYALSNQ